MLLIWQGFDHYWQREPHRLNRMASYVARTGDEPGEGVWTCCMQVGRFPPDVSHAHAMLHRLDVPGAEMIFGESSAVLGGRVGDRAEAAGVRVSLLIERPAAATVILRGFELLSTGFPHGFQTRGFGLWVADVEVLPEGGCTRVSFTPHFFIHPAFSPDPFTDPSRFVWRVLPFPAALEPSTPTEYEYTLTMHYAVLHAPAGEASFTPFAITQRAHAGARPYGAGWGEAQGVPGRYALATVGLTGFRFELADWDRTRYSGRYLRKLRLMLDGMTYRPVSGTLAYNPKLEFTNVGGRAGRTRARRVLRILRNRRHHPRAQRIRAMARALRGSYGFEASYRLDAVLMQFEQGTDHGVMRLYHALRRTVSASRMFG